MDPLFEISLFAYLVLRYRARRMRRRSPVSARDLIAMHDELLGISASLGRGWLDRAIRKEIDMRAAGYEIALTAFASDRAEAKAFSIKQR